MTSLIIEKDVAEIEGSTAASTSDVELLAEPNAITTRRLLRKLDLKLLPPLSLLYLLSFLDRSNGVSN